jgi:hypothetical protein
MRIAAIPWKIRVLGNKLSEARFHLGQKMYQEHVGDQTIIAQIAELTARMESPEPIDIGVFNRLKRDRRQLTLRLADLALAQDNSPTGLEVEYQEVVGIQAAIKALQGAAAALKPQLRPPTPVSWRRIGIGYATMVTLIIAITWALSPHRTSDTTAGAPLSKEISIDVGQGVRTPLPPEYRTLATHLTEDVKNSPDEFRDHKGMAEIIAEGHSAAMDLANIKSADADISYIASQGHEAFVEAIKHLEMIDALSKPPDADEKAKAIRAEVEGLIAAADRAEAAELPLPKVALKYAPPLAQDSTSIAIKFHESWGSIVGLYDWLLLENASGQPLEDCTIVVELTGAAGDVKKNVHFVREWPLQSWVYARYGGGKEIGGRTLGRTSVGLVQKIAVAVYSPRLSATVNYTYQGEEKDKDYAERCEKLTVRGRYRPFAGGVFSNDERAAILTLDGVDLLPKCKVTVAFVRGPGAGAAGPPEVKSWYWDLDCWKKGDEKTFATAKDQLSWDPDKIDVLIAFPNSSYEWKGTIVVR